MRVDPAELNELIRKRAYEIWEQEGRPHGLERQHWLTAEAEWRDYCETRSGHVRHARKQNVRTAAALNATAKLPAAGPLTAHGRALPSGNAS